MNRLTMRLTVGFVFLLAATAHAEPNSRQLAKQILDATGVRGGIVVHLGCGDGRLTASLHANNSYCVQGLDADEQNVAAARKHIQSLGLYGPVSVDKWSGGRLPYIDSSINLVVVEQPGLVLTSELMRALAPNGVAYVRSKDQWQKTVKPWPAGRDQWTHYLHDPSNNAVAHDTVIEPVSRYQWIGSPRYSRHHDHMSAISAVVSSHGRVFYILDKAPRPSIMIPPEWMLVARDAFNGTVLWERSIKRWHEHLWPLKSGPQILARRLVAIGDHVYTTLSIDAPLVQLDAATGKTLQTYDGTTATEEVLYQDGTLLLSVATKGQPLRSDPNKDYENLTAIRADITNPLWTTAPRTLMAVEADSGKINWKKETDLVSMSLAADARHLVFHNGERLECLDPANGKQMWETEHLPIREKMRSSSGATVVIHDDVVLYNGQIAVDDQKARTTTMFAISAKDGKTLWKAAQAPCGHMGTPADLLVSGNLVWSGAVAIGSDSGIMTGRDIETGKVKREFPPDVTTHWFHHRCYRAKATDKYLLFSRTGIEFVDWAKEHWICHHWVRGACSYGIMPANGLIYAPEHPCACYLEAKLFGFTALAPPVKSGSPMHRILDSQRLEQGPAYATVNSHAPDDLDWPTYRHDAARSGHLQTTVPVQDLKQAWTTTLGGKLTSPVVAEDKLFVASPDTHTVHALDAKTGKPAWSFTTGAHVDSPPTVWQGRVLFGSADGYVYCLRATDGKLAWRYRAAPDDLRMGAFEQIESVWPVHGNVLIENGVVYCTAGRSMFLDGGIRLLRLDPKTGHKLSETILGDQDPNTHKNLQSDIKALNMPVALPDILSSDGKYVYMRSLPFELNGKRKFVKYVPVREQQGDDLHLFSPTGFLDDTMWHRTYWLFGRAWGSGAGGYYQAGRRVPSGRIMVFDDTTVYGFGRHWQYYRWTTPLEFELFAASKHAPIAQASTERKPIRKNGKRVGVRTLAVTRFVPKWSADMPVQVSSLLLADNALLAAGPPDVVDEVAATRTLSSPKTKKQLAEQEEAFKGNRGALLVAVSPTTGQKLAAYKLQSMPRFDGMIAASGNLYMTTTNGQVICLGNQTGRPLVAAADVTVSPRPKVTAAATTLQTKPVRGRRGRKNRNKQ